MEDKKLIAKNKKIEKYLLNLQNGDKKAYLHLGNLYYECDEFEKAIEYYERAYSYGYVDCLEKLAISYFHSADDNKRNHGFNLLKNNLADGNGYFSYLLGLCYLNGIGTEKNEKEAIKYLEIAVKNNIDDAMVSLGKYYIDNTDEDGKLILRGIKLYKKAEKLGNIDACYNLGWVHEYLLFDGQKAIKYYKKAAQNGRYDAYWNIASIYYDGKLLPENKTLALRYYHEGAKHGDESSYSSLGIMYYNGEGTPENKKLAFEYFKKAAKKYNEAACVNLARFYLKGEIVKRNPRKAYELYLKVADIMKEACFNLALMNMDGIGCDKDVNKAISYYEKASMMGDIESMLALGNLYDEGKEVAKDKVKALHFYQMAADKDDPHGAYNVGRILLEQDLNNIQEALYYLEIASNKGVGISSLTISNLYYYGVGIQKDINQAIDYCKLAIEQGTNEGYNNLGLIYSDRNFAGLDYQKAFSYFEEGVKRQVYLAYYNLGILYEYGLGVYKDYKKAVELFKVAAEHGVNQAIGALIRAVKEYKEHQPTA